MSRLEDFTDRLCMLTVALQFDDPIQGCTALGGEINGEATIKAIQKAMTAYFRRAKKEQETPGAIERHKAVLAAQQAAAAKVMACSGLAVPQAPVLTPEEKAHDQAKANGYMPEPLQDRLKAALEVTAAANALADEIEAATVKVQVAAECDAGECDHGECPEEHPPEEHLIPLGTDRLGREDAIRLIRDWVRKHGPVDKTGTGGRGFIERGKVGQFMDPPRRRYRFQDGAWLVLRSTDGTLDWWRVDKSSEWTPTANAIGGQLPDHQRGGEPVKAGDAAKAADLAQRERTRLGLQVPPAGPLGKLLADARQAAGVSVQDVAVKLKRTDGFVRAVEEGYAKITKAEFVGFARLVGLEPEPLLAIYDEWVLKVEEGHKP